MTSERIIPLSEYHCLPQAAPTSDYYKNLLEAVCNNATFALFIINEHQQCVYMNPAAETLTGYRFAEMKGRILHHVIHHTHPDGRPYLLGECPIERALLQKNQVQGEEIFIHPDGHFYPVAYTTSPIREGDRITGTILEVRDLTQEKLAEQQRQEAAQRERNLQLEADSARPQIETVLSSISDGVYVLDRNWCFTYANNRLCEMAGKPREELLGRSNWELFPDAVNTDVYVQFHHAMNEQVQVQFEYLYLPWNRWFEYRVYPSEQGITVFAAEITERKRSKTEQKQAEEHLQKSEERFRLVTQAVNGLVFDWNLQTNEVYRSEKLYDLVGVYPKDAPPDANWWHERIHPDDLIRLQPQMTELFASSAQIYGAEYRVRHLDGHWVDVWEQACLIRDEQGQVIRIVGCTVDISDRKQAEAALQARSVELRHVTETAGVGLTRCSRDLRYLSANLAYAELVGLTQKEIVGRPIRDVIGETAFEVIRPYVERVLQGEQVEYEAEVPYAVGGTRCLYVVYRPDEDEHGNIIGWIASVIDIADRKRIEEALKTSEERLRFAVEGATLGTWEYDLVSSQIVWSERAKIMFGVPLDAEVDYETFMHTIHPDDRDRIHAAVEQAIAEQAMYDVEMRSVWADGSIHWIRSIGRARYNHSGVPTRIIGVALDITERKQTEATLRKSEERYRYLVEVTPQLVWTADAQGRNTYVSQQMCDYIGLSFDQLMDLNWQTVIHPDDVERVHRRWIESVQNGIPYEAEYRLRKADGVYGWQLVRALPSRNEQGQIIQWFGTSTDITDRKQTEAALRESLAILNAVNEVTPTLIYIKDREGRMVMVNPATVHLIGKPEADIIGKTVMDFLRQEEAEPIVENDRRVMETGQMIMFEETVVVPEGMRIFLSAKSPYRDEQGTVIGLIGVSTDITDRKHAESALRESERRLRRLVESNMFGVAFGDFRGGIQYVNDYFLNMVGYSRTEFEADQLRWIDITPAEFLPLDQKAMVELKANGVATPFEKEFIRKDSSRVPTLIGSALLQEPYDQQQEVIAFFIDLTERKQAEAEREKLLQQTQTAREEAEAANRIKDEFLAVLSHELRSPLNPILGWSKLLQTGKLDEAKTKQALTTIERNAKLQAELIEDLLDVSRILRGKLSLTVSSVNLASTIQAAIETVRLAAEAKSIQIETRLDPIVGLVSGDVTRLQQVVWNLLSNAVKFTPPGGRVEVRLDQVDNQVQITVSDTGKGISPNFLPHVFDYFRQEDGATTRKFGGLGLGLAIVHHLVELHGGTIQAESPGEGQGATFTVKLPLLPNVQVSQDGKSPETALDLTGVQVLVVDDDADTRELVAFLLEQSGARVVTANSAGEALLTLTRFQPDVLLSDIGMPDMDGYMLLRQVRALPPEQGGQIPAIALTAYAGEIDYQQAIAAGFQQHLTKPFEPQFLIQAISVLYYSRGKGNKIHPNLAR